MTALGFSVGRIAGYLAAPAFGFVSFVRRARTFHPRGPTLMATVTPHESVPAALSVLARRLEGHALVRFSGALWKRAEGIPDVLGCAVRFRRNSVESAEPAPSDQDLLCATILRPWTMPISPFTTDVRDYLANDYYAVSPFEVGLANESKTWFRLHPAHASHARVGRRSERLVSEMNHDVVSLDLAVAHSPYGPWLPVVTIRLTGLAHVDGEALRFRPFRSGRGLQPRGFVHALRIGVYALSQRTRPAVSPASGQKR